MYIFCIKYSFATNIDEKANHQKHTQYNLFYIQESIILPCGTASVANYVIKENLKKYYPLYLFISCLSVLAYGVVINTVGLEMKPIYR